MREELNKLGFSKTEASVYLVLVNLGEVLASTVARLAGIKRSTVYAALKRLEEKNLVCCNKKGKYDFFSIDDPNKIFLQEKDRYEAAKKLVEKMKETNKFLVPISVNYYRGRQGYRAIYDDILIKNPQEIMGWMNLDQFYQGIDMQKEKEWTRSRIKEKIYARLIMVETELTKKFQKLDKNSYRETKFFSKQSAFTTSCLMYEDTMCIFDPSKDMTGLRITNQEIYKMFKEIFEATWKSLS